jgi:formimidoylglutamate deiminase
MSIHMCKVDCCLHCQDALLPEGWARDVRLQLSGGQFVQIVSGVPAQSDDVRLALALPGLPNLHSHAFQRGMAGLTEYRGREADSFWSWRELMYRFLARMTPDDVEAISAQAFMEMLEAGFTRVGEFHYLHRDPSGASYADPAELSARIVAAAADSGIALTLLPVFYAHGGCGGAQPSAGQRRFLTDPDGYARLFEACRALTAHLPHARTGIAPHSLRAVTPEELALILPLAGDGPIHIHAAEQQREVDECLAWSGRRPIEWLLSSAPIDARWCIVHATHMTAAENEGLARSAAVAGLCPITEANLGDGFFPALEFRAARGTLGIGTDSNVQIAPNAELRQLEYTQRLQQRARNVLAGDQPHTGRALFEAALQGGSQALGVAGGIALGAPADLISLDVSAPLFAGRSPEQQLDTWLFAANGGGVDSVWRAGVQLVSNGQHRARETIQARYRRALEKLLST